MFTNVGLVAHAEKALKENWGYVFGTFGGVLTDVSYGQKLLQYQKEVGKYADFIKANYIGKRTSDCVGLIKSYIWWTESGPVYNSKEDVSANGMLAKAKEKGLIATLPKIPGICVHKEGHIGVYVGGNSVIEAHGTKSGVIKTPITGPGATAWTSWLKCPFISYTEIAKPVDITPIKMPESVKEILHKVSKNNAEDWEEAISKLLIMADKKEVPRIFSFLPLLIQDIYTYKKGGGV